MELTREQLIVIWIIAILALSVLILILPKFAKTAGRVVRNAAVGCCLLWAIGAIFGANASVGLNPVTAGVCGILGIPGAAMLMIIHQIL